MLCPTHPAGVATPGQPPAERQVEVEACLTLKQGLLQRISQLALPPNFLDQLIDELGGPKQVAEMTGGRDGWLSSFVCGFCCCCCCFWACLCVK